MYLVRLIQELNLDGCLVLLVERARLKENISNRQKQKRNEEVREVRGKKR